MAACLRIHPPSLHGSARPSTSRSPYYLPTHRTPPHPPSPPPPQDPMRLAANTVRVKSSLTPLKSDVGLSKAALSLAQELAEKDSTDAPEATQKHLERAQAAGYQGKSVKVNVFSADAKDIDKKDVETHALTAVGGFTASKDATAGLEDPKNTDIGSAGYMSTTGKAYYVSYYGAFR